MMQFAWLFFLSTAALGYDWLAEVRALVQYFDPIRNHFGSWQY